MPTPGVYIDCFYCYSSPMEHSAAYHAGQIIGVIIFAGLVLSFLVFGVIAIVKAFTRKTVGWIIIGSLCGVFFLAPVALFSYGVFVGIKEGIARRAGKAGTLLAESSKTQTVNGKRLPYSLLLPAGWKLLDPSSGTGLDLVAAKGDDYVGIRAQEIAMNSSEDAASLVRRDIRSRDANAEVTENETLVFRRRGMDEILVEHDPRSGSIFA